MSYRVDLHDSTHELSTHVMSYMVDLHDSTHELSTYSLGNSRNLVGEWTSLCV